MFRLSISAAAQNDIDVAFLYYENVQTSLGERFLSELQNRFDDLEQNPQFYSFIHPKLPYRDVLLKVFPYVIVFEIINDAVSIIYITNAAENRSPKSKY